jgi:hypothetical protein
MVNRLYSIKSKTCIRHAAITVRFAMLDGIYGFLANLISQTRKHVNITPPSTSIAMKEPSFHRPGFKEPVRDSGIRMRHRPATRSSRPTRSISVHNKRHIFFQVGSSAEQPLTAARLRDTTRPCLLALVCSTAMMPISGTATHGTAIAQVPKDQRQPVFLRNPSPMREPR